MNLQKKLEEVLVGGVNSPVRAFTHVDEPPLIAASAKGSILTDIHGKKYIDYCGSWGALILGHCPKSVCQAVSEQLQRGTSFGLSTEAEEKLARSICSCLPSIEKLRFTSSGTEAVMGALRLARAVTGKNLIIKFIGNYHGSSDSLLTEAGSALWHASKPSSSLGVPAGAIADTLSLPYNDIPAFQKAMALPGIKNMIAAIIIEPFAGNMGFIPADPDFLKLLSRTSRESAALLIFDEVITGFRIGLQSAQGFYGISPDLSCLGKIIGGGFPAAAFGGPAKYMDALAPLGKVFHGGTLSGNPIAMEAGLATLKILREKNFYSLLEEKSKILTQGLKDYIKQNSLPLSLHSQASCFSLFFQPKIKRASDVKASENFKAYFTYMLKHGIYIPPSPFETSFISSAHTEQELSYTRDTIINFLKQSYP